MNKTVPTGEDSGKFEEILQLLVHQTEATLVSSVQQPTPAPLPDRSVTFTSLPESSPALDPLQEPSGAEVPVLDRCTLYINDVFFGLQRHLPAGAGSAGLAGKAP